MRPVLRLPWNRGTTAQVCVLRPGSVAGPVSQRGMFVGVDTSAGGAEFCWDPFEAYAAGLVTNPNVWVLGAPGNGKSALVKSLLWRMAALYPQRWVAIADPKGEYTTLAERLGMSVVRLSPGGPTRVNPLADGPAGTDEPLARRVMRRAATVTTLAATVLERGLTPVEDAAVFAAVADVLGAAGAGQEPTLKDVAGLLLAPTPAMVQRMHQSAPDAVASCQAVYYALDKLLHRSLQGLFDGPSTVRPDWHRAGLVVDFSAVPMESEAFPLVMVAVAGWLSELMACPGPQRVQVLDEAWALLGSRSAACYLQQCWKLGRGRGVANVGIAHRASDLAAQADDGTATAKIARGLLADTATKIILRQDSEELDAAEKVFGLTSVEKGLVGQLDCGEAVWHVGSHRAMVVHILGSAERDLVDTDQRMRSVEGSSATNSGVLAS